MLVYFFSEFPHSFFAVGDVVDERRVHRVKIKLIEVNNFIEFDRKSNKLICSFI